MRIEYHRTLIADRVRNDAFHKALKAVIEPGKTVVADIGAGTGLLGLMAAKLGAKKVFLYEAAEVAQVAARVLKANHARTCEIIPCHSTDMRNPPKVDVIVSETLGNHALEENIIATLNDARRRFLKPGGTIIPSRIVQLVSPVTGARIHDELTAWDRVGHGIDLAVPREMSLNNVYVRTLAVRELLDAEGKAWDTVDLTREAKSNRKGEASWTADRDTVIHGIAGWWLAELVPGVVLSTAPQAPRTHWEQLYYPLMEPLHLGGGDTVTAALRSRSSEEAGTHLAWTVTQTDGRGRQVARQAMDLDRGYLP